jgi:hypothetical protein
MGGGGVAERFVGVWGDLPRAPKNWPWEGRSNSQDDVMSVNILLVLKDLSQT